MKTISAIIAAAIATLLSTALVAPAQAVNYGTGECTINLASTYVTNDGQSLMTFPAASVVSCATFTFDPTAGDSIYARFTTASGRGNAMLTVTTSTTVDPVTNASVSIDGLQLNGTSTEEAYSQLTPSSSGGYDVFNVVTHGGQEYLLKMGNAFTIVEGYTGDACTLTVPKLSYTWGQPSFISLKDSAMTCAGFTWNSKDYEFSQQFVTAAGSTVSVRTTERKVYDPATKTMKLTVGLEASLPVGNDEYGNFLGLRSRGASTGPASDVFGKYIAWPSQSNTYKILQPIPPVSYPVTLAKSFKFKAATTIDATPTRVAGTNQISIHVEADRNQSFQNGNTPTYKRQSVIPSRDADHPTILRGGKVIKTVTLSKFGEATVTVKDKGGKQKYTIQMESTASNWAGKTSFKM